MQRLRDPGMSGTASSDANGARTMPSSEMLAAPSRNAVQTLAGGPGRSSAAITSHRIKSAGAIAAVPMTVGRDSRRSIWTGRYAIFRELSALGNMRMRQQAAGIGFPDLLGRDVTAQQPRQMFLSRASISGVFGADRIDNLPVIGLSACRGASARG